ncbi:MAG TPA: hypothetical protein VMX79_11580 [bacterium]|nr:hypothetical protein [bacterium]
MTTISLAQNIASTGFEIADDVISEASEPGVTTDELFPLPWHTLISQAVLARDWDNEDDAIYDNWRELYGVPAR